MKDSNNSDLRDKLIGLGKTSMRKNYYADLLKEKQKLEEQNQQLTIEVTQRREAETALQILNNELEDRILKRTAELEALNNELQNSYGELKQAHQYLVQSEKLAALGGLVAGISHEVNTPLGICVTSSTYLLNILQDLQRLYAEKILTASRFKELSDESIQSANILINNLMRSVDLLENFKLIAVDQTNYEYRTFNYLEYTRRILTNLHPEIKKKKVEIDIICDDTLSAKGYPGILTQILSNLIMNSLIHGFKENREYGITIAYWADEDFIVMEYKDNGCGMSAHQAKHAFDPFFTTTRGSGGSGLGLYIVFNLVTTLLRGALTLETEQDKGVFFTIKVPRDYRIPTDI